MCSGCKGGYRGSQKSRSEHGKSHGAVSRCVMERSRRQPQLGASLWRASAWRQNRIWNFRDHGTVFCRAVAAHTKDTKRKASSKSLTMTGETVHQTPSQGSIAASPDADSTMASPEMDGASFEALMKERTRVSFCWRAVGVKCKRDKKTSFSHTTFSQSNISIDSQREGGI